MTTKTTTSKSWACPQCGAQDPEHISLVDGLAFRCPACRTVYIFTSFDEAYKNGWGRDTGVYRKNELELRVIALEELAKRLLNTIAKMQEENSDMQRDIRKLRNTMTWY